MKKLGIIFDLDGTLLDSVADLAYFGNEILKKYGFGTHATEVYKHLAGYGTKEFMRRASKSSDDEMLDRMTDEFKALYEANLDRESKPYEGIYEVLGEIATLPIKRGVLSNKPHHLTVECVNKFFPNAPFDVVFGHKDEFGRKPDPTSALEIARLYRLKPSEILFVGDTRTDMETAKSAGMFALGVTWGFRDRSELEEYGADGIINKPKDIINYLK